MQDMIKRIIEADNKAKELEEANRKAAEAEKRHIEEEADSIYQKYMDDAKIEIERDSAYLEKRTERSLAEVKAKQESVLIKLRQEYRQNRDKWVDEIVNRVLDRR